MRASTGNAGPRPRRRTAGWTVIELMIAVGIIGLLTAIAFPLYRRSTEKARIQEAITEIRTIESAIDQFRHEFARVPPSIDGLLDPMPVDPWGNPYRYLPIEGTDPSTRGDQRKDKNLNPLNTDYDLYSEGADGRSAGPLTAKDSLDDVVRARDGAFVGLARDH